MALPVWNFAREYAVITSKGFPMQIVICSASRSRFLSLGGQWTDKRSQARPFADAWEALDFAGQHRLEHIHLLYDFPDPRRSFSVSLAEIAPQPSPRDVT